MSNKRLSTFWFCAGIIVFLGVWEGISLYLNSEILLPSPVAVMKRLFLLVPTEKFLKSFVWSFVRVMAGLVISVPLGIAAGLAAGLNRNIDFFLRPFFTLVAATPVMAIILIVFLWLGSELTPIFTAFLMVFPVMAANTREAVRTVDPRFLELFDAFNMTRREKLRYLYIPSIVPALLGGLRASLSLSWKVVAAAEVLVQPVLALGTGMQAAKANLETAELFAWTIAAIVAANLCEAILAVFIKFIK